MKKSELRQLIKEIIKEAVGEDITRTTIGDLKFGENVFDGYYLPSSPGYLKVMSQNSIDKWRENQKRIHPELDKLEAEINNKTKYITIPAFEESRKKEADAIMNLLSREKRGTYFGD